MAVPEGWIKVEHTPERTALLERAASRWDDVKTCGACGSPLEKKDAESCSSCAGPICVPCWDADRHCQEPLCQEREREVKASH